MSVSTLHSLDTIHSRSDFEVPNLSDMTEEQMLDADGIIGYEEDMMDADEQNSTEDHDMDLLDETDEAIDIDIKVVDADDGMQGQDNDQDMLLDANTSRPNMDNDAMINEAEVNTERVDFSFSNNTSFTDHGYQTLEVQHTIFESHAETAAEANNEPTSTQNPEKYRYEETAYAEQSTETQVETGQNETGQNDFNQAAASTETLGTEQHVYEEAERAVPESTTVQPVDEKSPGDSTATLDNEQQSIAPPNEETTQQEEHAAETVESRESSHSPEHSERRIPPIIAYYEENELCLYDKGWYEPKIQNAEHSPEGEQEGYPISYLLSDLSSYTEKLDNVFTGLRATLQAGEDDEIKLGIDTLGLTFGEDNIQENSFTLSDIHELYLKFAKREEERTMCVSINLVPRAMKRWSELLRFAAEGKTFADLAEEEVSPLHWEGQEEEYTIVEVEEHTEDVEEEGTPEEVYGDENAPPESPEQEDAYKQQLREEPYDDDDELLPEDDGDGELAYAEHDENVGKEPESIEAEEAGERVVHDEQPTVERLDNNLAHSPGPANVPVEEHQEEPHELQNNSESKEFEEEDSNHEHEQQPAGQEKSEAVEAVEEVLLEEQIHEQSGKSEEVLQDVESRGRDDEAKRHAENEGAFQSEHETNQDVNENPEEAYEDEPEDEYSGEHQLQEEEYAYQDDTVEEAYENPYESDLNQGPIAQGYGHPASFADADDEFAAYPGEEEEGEEKLGEKEGDAKKHSDDQNHVGPENDAEYENDESPSEADARVELPTGTESSITKTETVFSETVEVVESIEEFDRDIYADDDEATLRETQASTQTIAEGKRAREEDDVFEDAMHPKRRKSMTLDGVTP